jgi:cell division protein FtsZ
MAVSSPLLEASIEGAHGVLLSIAGGSDLGLFEVSAAANLIQSAAHEDANIIFGTVIDDALGDEVRVTVIAAGFEGGQPPRRQPGVTRQADIRTQQRLLAADGAAHNGGSGNSDRHHVPAPAGLAPAGPATSSVAPAAHGSGSPSGTTTPGTGATFAGAGSGNGSAAGPVAVSTVAPVRKPPIDDDDLDVPDFLK